MVYISKNIDKNTEEGFVDELKTLGLSHKEAQVYLALITLGETGTSAISSKTELHGQYVYQALDTLEQKGLVQHVIKRGRKKFSAKSPETLSRLADEKRILAESLAERLTEVLVLPPGQQFEVYQGRESFLAHEFEMLGRAKNGSELLVIGGKGDQFYETIGDRLREYDKIRLKKEISIRYIGSEAQREALLKTHAIREKFEIRLLPGLFTGSVNTNVWPDSLGFNIFGEPVTRFTMTSEVVAGSYRQFFETLWNLGKK